MWNDPWLAFPYEFKVVTKNPFLAHPMKVCDLIDPNTLSWKNNVLDALFIPRDK